MCVCRSFRSFSSRSPFICRLFVQIQCVRAVNVDDNDDDVDDDVLGTCIMITIILLLFIQDVIAYIHHQQQAVVLNLPCEILQTPSFFLAWFRRSIFKWTYTHGHGPNCSLANQTIEWLGRGNSNGTRYLHGFQNHLCAFTDAQTDFRLFIRKIIIISMFK